MVAIVARCARPAKRWQWSDCARSSFLVMMKGWRRKVLRCCNLVLDNKPFRFCYSDDYHLQAVRFDILWDKMLGTQSIHTKRLEVQFVQSFLLLSVVALQ